jgi:hypothetical protein
MVLIRSSNAFPKFNAALGKCGRLIKHLGKVKLHRYETPLGCSLTVQVFVALYEREKLPNENNTPPSPETLGHGTRCLVRGKKLLRKDGITKGRIYYAL